MQLPEIDWDEARAKAQYPELIGKMVRDDAPEMYWARCGCKMLQRTTRDLHGTSVTCANCKANAAQALEAASLEAPPPSILTRRGERTVNFALALLLLVGAALVGSSVNEAPPRDAPSMPMLD